MRLATVHNLPTGGALRVLVEYAKRTTNEVTIYARCESSADAELRDWAHLVPAPFPPADSLVERWRLLSGAPSLGAELARRIDADGHDAVLCFSSTLTQASEVAPYLRTPSLYYAPEPLRAYYERRRATFGHGLRQVLARRGLNPFELMRARLDRRFIRGAPHVMTHSRFTAQRLRAIYGVESAVVPLGVDAGSFTPGSERREAVVLSVGALHPLKGHQFVIEALATLSEPRPRLVVVGDRGEYEGQLRELAARRGVTLDLRQAIPFDELLDLYRRAGVMACGQIDEPFGLIALEAMATGTPLAAVAEGGFLETVTDGVTGLLSPREPAEFAARLTRVLEDEELAGRLGAAGRMEAEERWTWEATARGVDHLLETCVAERRAAA